MSDLTLSRSQRKRLALPRLAGAWYGYSALLALVGVAVLGPFVLVLANSVQVGVPGQPAQWSLQAWSAAFTDASIITALWNTLAITVVRQGIAFPLGILIAWLIARTDLPGARRLEFLYWLAFFLPVLPITQGWILMLDPKFGILNSALASIPFIGQGPFNVYSFWGIIWVHLATSTVAIKVMLLTPAFRNLDSTFEEASFVSGVNTLGTVRRIVLPVMLPVLLVTLILSLIHSLQTFEVEQILGPPAQIFVFSTRVYTLINQQPPAYAMATALSSLVLLSMAPFIVAQRWLTRRSKNFTTVSGRFRVGKTRLGPWRIPAFLLVFGVAMLTTFVPFLFLVGSTFMRLFGFFNLSTSWTTAHWGRVLGDPVFTNSVRNTLVLAFGSALLGMALFALIAYVTVRTTYRARGALDFISWLPSTLPGIILSLGLLWLVFALPFLRPLYGTMLVLVIATVVSSMTLGVQLIKSSLVQFGEELEEAVYVGGGTWWHAYRYVVLPLLAPVLLLVGAMTFVAATRNVSAVALLSTGSTRPLALLQLDYMVEGRYEPAAVVGVIVALMAGGVALAGRALGRRFGLQD